MDIIQIDFESLKQNHWSEQEVQNAKLVADFVLHLMNKHNFDYVKQQYGNDAYVQHNRNIADGVDGLLDNLKQLTKRFPEFTYDVKHIYADGDKVIFHSHATVRKKDRGNDQKGFNIHDVWTIKDGNIVEHWDSIQALDGFMRFYGWLSGGTIRNSNGVF